MEIWKDIDGFENYMVSNKGNILNKITNKIKNQYDGYGYNRVTLCKKGKTKHFQVHRLVASAFLEKQQGKDEVNHINGNKKDNNVQNLEWCNRKENELHCYRNNPKLHKTSIILQYDLNGNFIKEWFSIKEAEQTLNINNISKCCRGLREKAGGYKWKYKRKYIK